jgi:CheY-like chemotaxis protein
MVVKAPTLAPLDPARIYKVGLSERWDVLIVDRMRPQIDGIEVVESPRRGGAMASILILTTLAGVDDRVRGLNAGADDWTEGNRRDSECAFHDAAIDSQCGTGRRRRKGTRDVGHERGNLLGRGEAFDERGRPDLFKKLCLNLCTGLAPGLGQCVDEFDNSAGLGWTRQNAVDRNTRAGDRFRQAPRNGDLGRLGHAVMDHLSRYLQRAFTRDKDDPAPVGAFHPR